MIQTLIIFLSSIYIHFCLYVGPNSSTTVVSEEIMMQFITGKDEPATEEQSELDKLKASVKGNVKCRICKMDHWTKECPYKDDLGAIKVKYLIV